MKDYVEIFFTFLKMGAFTFGGGYAMLPMIEKEIVDNKHWATNEEVLDYFAVGQCTPGVIAVNTSTFVGYKRKGSFGGVVATAGFILPSLVIISLIAAFLNNFDHLKIVQSAFWGIRVSVCVLMANSIQKMIKSGIVDVTTAIIASITFLGMIFIESNPVYYVVVGAVAGIAISRWKKHGGEKR